MPKKLLPRAMNHFPCKTEISIFSCFQGHAYILSRTIKISHEKKTNKLIGGRSVLWLGTSSLAREARDSISRPAKSNSVVTALTFY